MPPVAGFLPDAGPPRHPAPGSPSPLVSSIPPSARLPAGFFGPTDVNQTTHDRREGALRPPPILPKPPPADVRLPANPPRHALPPSVSTDAAPAPQPPPALSRVAVTSLLRKPRDDTWDRAPAARIFQLPPPRPPRRPPPAWLPTFLGSARSLCPKACPAPPSPMHPPVAAAGWSLKPAEPLADSRLPSQPGKTEPAPGQLLYPSPLEKLFVTSDVHEHQEAPK